MSPACDDESQYLHRSLFISCMIYSCISYMIYSLTATAACTDSPDTPPSCGNGRSFTAEGISGQFRDERSSSSWIKRAYGSSGPALALCGPGALPPCPKSASSCGSGDPGSMSSSSSEISSGGNLPEPANNLGSINPCECMHQLVYMP
jgi:hypothetical protein